MFVGGRGVLLVFDIYICPNLSHTSIIVSKLTSIKPRIPQNRLMGYIVTLIRPDKHLWEYVMNSATLYSCTR